DPSQASKCTLSERGDLRPQGALQKLIHHQLTAISLAKQQHPGKPMLLLWDEIGQVAPGRFRLPFYNQPRAHCEMIRLHDLSPHLSGWYLLRSFAVLRSEHQSWLQKVCPFPC